MLSNGLVAPAILGPLLQFTLRGFVAGTTADEGLTFKPFISLALRLALWSCLHLLWLLLLARLLAVCL